MNKTRAIQISRNGFPLAAGHDFIPIEAAIHMLSLPNEGSLDVIYLPQVVEYLSPAGATRLLRSCAKALRPGGRVRLTALDLDALLRRVSSCDVWGDEGWDGYRFRWNTGRVHILNFAIRDREWAYNEDEMRLLCGMVGFRDGVRVKEENEGPYIFENLDKDTLTMEFYRPRRFASEKPKVSILIPLYKTDFFLSALRSALEQTWDNLEIVICNDGPSETAESIIGRFKDHPNFHSISYYKNETRLWSTGNYRECLRRAKGLYFKFLNDDDLLEPTCVEKMATCLRDYPGVTLVTSHRRIIDAAGNATSDIGPTVRPVRESSVVEGRSAIDALLRQQVNFIGEPSTAMFRKEDIVDIESQFTSIFGLELAGNSDASAWISLLSKGDLIYLSETLSSFRIHEAQEQHDPANHAVCVAWWQRAAEWAEFCGIYSKDHPVILHALPLTSFPWWPPEVRQHNADALAALKRGAWEDAASSITAALERLPGEARLELLRVRLLAASGQEATALKVIAGILESSRDTVPLLLECAEIAAVAGDRDLSNSAIAMAHSAHPLLVPVAGVFLRNGETSLAPEARFQLLAELPDVEVRLSLKCAMPADGPELPVINIVAMVDSQIVCSGVLRGYSSVAELKARIPRNVAPTRFDIRWQSQHVMFPSPTTEQGTVLLTGLFLSVAPLGADP